MRLAVVVLAAACASAPQRAHTPAIDASRVQIAALMEKEKIPGAVVAVTAGDRIVWQEAFGVTDLTTKAAVRPKTRFRVGSLTKLMTVAALMRLADQGKLSTDDPVSRHLPDFPHGEITLRQLAGHTAGVRHYTRDEFFNNTRYASATDSLRKFAADPLLSRPGEKYFYSSYGYNVLGAVIERVSGQSFDKALRSLVFEPLGMISTSFVADSETASFYDASKNGPEASPPIDLSDRLPAGAAYSTAGDLARLLIASTGRSFLSEKARTTMFTSLQLSDGKATNVGMAWRVAVDDRGRAYVHHGGAVLGGRATALTYPNERVGVVLVTNLGFAGFDERDAKLIAERFLDGTSYATTASRYWISYSRR